MSSDFQFLPHQSIIRATSVALHFQSTAPPQRLPQLDLSEQITAAVEELPEVRKFRHAQKLVRDADARRQELASSFFDMQQRYDKAVESGDTKTADGIAWSMDETLAAVREAASVQNRHEEAAGEAWDACGAAINPVRHRFVAEVVDSSRAALDSETAEVIAAMQPLVARLVAAHATRGAALRTKTVSNAELIGDRPTPRPAEVPERAIQIQGTPLPAGV